jgi:FkbM family methyltransferase
VSVAVRIVGLAARVVPEPALVWIRRRPRLSRLGSRLLPPATQVVRVAHGPAQGALLEVDLTREKAFWLGIWEPELADVIEREAHGSSWDVGANIGYFTIVLVRRSEHVLAVEANPALVPRLRRNVALNEAAVEVVEAAVAGAEGELLFEISSETGMSRIAGSGGITDAPIVDTVRVEATTLDRLLDEHGRPDFAKLDIEGAELAALEAAPRFLSARPSLLCDLHGADAHSRVPELLRCARYDVAYVQPSCILARPLAA